MKPFIAALSTLVLFAGIALGAEWDPKTSQVVLVSVTRWSDPAVPDFDKLGRADGRLERALLRSGVPADNLHVLKDEAGTHAAVHDALVAAARATPAGGTVIFYFSGHGHRDGRGTVTLATHDMQQDAAKDTGLRLDELARIFEENAQGKRVLLLGDACYSGALDRVVKRLGARGIEAASLASVTATNMSTGRWTFTQRLIEAFAGDAAVAKDGVVTFASLKSATADAMRFEENQPTEATSTRSFDEGFVFRAVDARRRLRSVEGPYQLRDYVEARSRRGAWGAAQVVEEWNGRYLVRFTEDDHEEWLPVARMRAPRTRTVATGAAVRVRDEEGWWDARVRDARDGFAFVSFDDLPRSWDEWVPLSRVRVPRTSGLTGLLDERIGEVEQPALGDER